jgi:hypothetical protein
MAADMTWDAKQVRQRWAAKADTSNSLAQARYFSPKVVIRKFRDSRIRDSGYEPSYGRYVKPVESISLFLKSDFVNPLFWANLLPPNSRSRDPNERSALTLYLTEQKRVETVDWIQAFCEEDIYANLFNKFTREIFERDNKMYKMFDRIKRVDREIIDGMTKSLDPLLQELKMPPPPDALEMTRQQHNDLRKFLFLTNSLTNRNDVQHLLNHESNLTDAKADRVSFMTEKRLSHERELWLATADHICEDTHYGVAADDDIHTLDRRDYQTNARERFMVIWRASGPDDEFVLTDNSFGCFEGSSIGQDDQINVKMTRPEVGTHMYTKDYMWHQIFVVSPKIAIVLCHGSFASDKLISSHKKRFGLEDSILRELPHPIPASYYKDMTRDEVNFLNPNWNIGSELANSFGSKQHSPRTAKEDNIGNETLGFAISNLSSEDVHSVNAVLLQNRSDTWHIQQVCLRSNANKCLLRSLRKFSEIDWKRQSTVRQRGNFKRLTELLVERIQKQEEGFTNQSSLSQGSSDVPSLGYKTHTNPFEIRRAPPPAVLDPPIIHQERPPLPPHRQTMFSSRPSSRDRQDEPVIITPSQSRPYLHARKVSRGTADYNRTREGVIQHSYETPSSPRRIPTRDYPIIGGRPSSSSRKDEEYSKITATYVPTGHRDEDPALMSPRSRNMPQIIQMTPSQSTYATPTTSNVPSAASLYPSSPISYRPRGASDASGHDDEYIINPSTSYGQYTPPTSNITPNSDAEMTPDSSNSKRHSNSVKFKDETMKSPTRKSDKEKEKDKGKDKVKKSKK